MRIVKLSDVSAINPRKAKGLDTKLPCSFVPMQYVDDVSGSIIQMDNRPVGEVEKGYTAFQENDVLFAKITPCMENGKCAIARNLINKIGFGSTEFHVLRAQKETIPEWIYYYLRQERIREQAVHWFRGTAGQQRVPSTFLEELEIPLPPLPEQERIAAVLDKADRLRRLRRYAIQLGDSYLQSVFLEMFGDPITNPMGWEMRKLGKHIKFITSGSRGWAQYYSSSGARFIRSLDVRMNHIANSDAVFVIPPKSPETERTRVQANDVLLTITGSRIGRVAPVPINIKEAYISQHVSLLRLDNELSSEYISRFLSLPRGGQYQIAKSQYGQTKPGLNLTQIKDLKIPFPPKPMRDKYLEVVQHYERLRSQQRESLRQAEHLFESLLSQSFSDGALGFDGGV